MTSIKKQLLVIPSIDIQNRKTVRIVKGIPELDCRDYDNDPVEMAMLWRAENAKMLHIVDFDGAFDHSNKNWDIIKEICNSVIIPIEFAGGVRSIDEAEAIFELGVYRIAINTMALENRSEFIKLFEKFGPTKIVLSIDILNSKLVTRGRQKQSDLNYFDFVNEMVQIGIDRVIVTDVNRNGVMQGPNIDLSKSIAEKCKVKVTHSGGVRNKDELFDLQELLPIGVDSVIIGRAFYENRFPCQKLWRLAESGLFN
ncbi:MAG: 1-(5-phosphoribosyl)-5-[(5-phosphoribosylamino)methylideneamino] imidazole-4-carboxamide isomerase [Ignavibacteriota bacterium]|nr:1-(5-phosphoribosyl)-5-[(5-phosphoribosylamino)methylideneamino] imidazole-4-carboxamide isomerase [Ignavibacteriota bacterium]MCO6446110.1 1-(5-phosphoribosyl)-5-[(5-phosphoribosylamino)methylideneamino] imidazole-4-carboxamide isomerase [Ignavibacterium album]MCZ2267629.1 1-(5-phosphoribosyl)-5-[(5-phosphoribosylamino)methylideneamino] imidazole-4-carboxamide isomerase [Ignavibacteriales bacterium]QKJ99036.1 MAG: 1-(5-phosphoribosyl)-5-[(5-phosphoribosylamino)methylideneamino] imidazole-4-c